MYNIRQENNFIVGENFKMSIIEDALNIAYAYVISISNPEQVATIKGALAEINQVGDGFGGIQHSLEESYQETQDILSRLNEKESIRKSKGVYYTPSDVVKFIVANSIKLSSGELTPDNISDTSVNQIEYKDFCKQKTAFDPTCGAGEFLLAVLEQKFDLWESNSSRITKNDIEKIVGTIHGNDINEESITIAKLRLYLCAAHRYGIDKCKNIPRILNENFTTCDYVVNPPDKENTYDIITGNPPYVEDAKSGLNPPKSYGNIYANVLVNAAERLKQGGAFGFIIPLSYVSTPRMKQLREDLYQIVPEQFILSYSDRPDCLFTSVHQKLCILLCKNSNNDRKIYTGNYQYWYKEERDTLFRNTTVVPNSYVLDSYIPKIGNEYDMSIYSKVTTGDDRKSIINMSTKEGDSVYLNMRAAFWIKAFRNAHKGSEYKVFNFDDPEKADYCMCLLNSSLFWWYWVCVSDCWHITRKELLGFMAPNIADYTEVRKLASMIESRLEETKEYVGTVQTDYEYKHKLCVNEIHEIDDYINPLFGLTEEEGEYIKNFAHVYRISGGVTNEGN